MKRTFLAMVTILGLTTNAFACDEHGTTGFVPQNNMRIPVGLKALVGGISETQFNEVINKVEKLYKDEISKAGGKLLVQRNWNDPTVNAFACRSNETDCKIQGNKNWIVAMFGGLARHPAITADGFTIVMCHELGHHIGGAPKKLDRFATTKTWATNEGQADYFGTMKCLRKVFLLENNTQIVSKMQIPESVSTKCNDVYSNEEEIAICKRSAMAGLSVAKLFNDLSGDSAVDFTKPDSAVVAKTYHAHPASQCRLDTYFQASLCDVSVKEEVSDTDEFQGVCATRNGDKIGVRPSCWYAEAN